MEPYTIKIDAFEGPFDLLFHLIEKNKVDIYDIPISLIADQYLDYLTAMREMDLEIASGFLVMASTLLHIKSRTLLPVQKDTGDEDPADPREALIVSIIEYKKYKEFTASLRENAAYWGEARYRPAGLYERAGEWNVYSGYVFGAGGIGGTGANPDANSAAAAINQAAAENPAAAGDPAAGAYLYAGATRQPEQLSLYDMDRGRLLSVYGNIVEMNRRRHENIVPKVRKILERDQVTLARKVREIIAYLVNKPRFLFQKLFNPATASKLDIITGFTAVLELSRQGRLTLRQKKQFGGLLVSRKQ